MALDSSQDKESEKTPTNTLNSNQDKKGNIQENIPSLNKIAMELLREDLCKICSKSGELIRFDGELHYEGCDNSFHIACIGFDKIY